MRRIEAVWLALFLAAVTGILCWFWRPKPPIRAITDPYPEITRDLFPAMDGGMRLSPAEAQGRNTWLLWCAGNEAFWDRMARQSDGIVDLLKTIDSRGRSSRFKRMGLINQPGFRTAQQPDHYGLYLDEPVEPENQSIDPAVYGRSTGIMGLRLFVNPAFQGDAAKQWDPIRYEQDVAYARNPKLVRPYQVGVSCAACHVAFSPVRPPANPEQPDWDNLVSTVGNQYLREGRVFAAPVRPGGFMWEMLEAQPAGTSDTSRLATDHINNPGAINGIFSLAARTTVAQPETLQGETLLLPGTAKSQLAPLILKDGADSAGLLAAALRVYVNIGLDSDDWLERHDVLIGRRAQAPFGIAGAAKHSGYFRSTEAKLPHLAEFLQRMRPFQLKDAPGGARYLTSDPGVLASGKRVFAAHCVSCHSSKRPPPEADARTWFAAEVQKSDFTEGNFFSDGERHPVTEIHTNAERAFGSNAILGHIWSDFSSETYKNQRSPGTIRVWNPFTQAEAALTVPGGGRGYYVTPSLLGLWSSAPFFHNNALGLYTADPSVEGRMKAFDDAVTKLLWPERRAGMNSIWRTAHESSFEIPTSAIPAPLLALLERYLGSNDGLSLGPIPAGTPINLIANLNLQAPATQLVETAVAMIEASRALKNPEVTSQEVEQLWREKLGPALLRVNTCPDFVEDRGHTFGSRLPDSEKRALIEYLKTL